MDSSGSDEDVNEIVQSGKVHTKAQRVAEALQVVFFVSVCVRTYLTN